MPISIYPIVFCTLNLDLEDGEVYEDFIENMIDTHFTESVPSTPTLSLDGEAQNEYQKVFDAKLNECFKKGFPASPARSLDGNVGENSISDTSSVESVPRISRTALFSELMSNKNWVFQVRLTYKKVDLYILIRRLDLYLVGYKGKDEIKKKDEDTEKDETEIVDNWIILSGEHSDKVTKSVKTHYMDQAKKPIEPKQAELSTSYTSLFGQYESTFREEAQQELSENLDNKLKDQLEKNKNFKKKELEKMKIYVEDKLNKVKEDLEKVKIDVEKKNEYNRQAKQINSVEKLLERLRGQMANREFEEEDTRVKDLRTYVEDKIEKLEKQYISANKLIKKLEKKMDSEAGVDAHISVPGEFLSWIHLWQKKLLEKSGSLDMVKRKLEKENKSMKQVKEMLEKEEMLKTELTVVEKLVVKLRKRFTREMEKEELEKKFSEELEKKYSQELKKELKEFKEELRRKIVILKEVMKVLNGDANLKMVKEKTESFKLNRNALISAVRYLTSNPFKEDSTFALHIIILIQMISEAARFKNITTHIRDNYMKSDEHTEALTREMIALQHMWTKGSTIVSRGRFLEGEEFVLKGVKLSYDQVCELFTCIRGRTYQEKELE